MEVLRTTKDKRLEQLSQAVERMSTAGKPAKGRQRTTFGKKLHQQPDDSLPQPVFLVWARGTLPMKLFIKQQCASTEGARRLARGEIKHHKSAALGVNSALWVGGTISALKF